MFTSITIVGVAPDGVFGYRHNNYYGHINCMPGSGRGLIKFLSSDHLREPSSRSLELKH